MPSINNFLKGFTDGLPGMKDFRHASRLYLDDNFKLMPKQKFLYHVVFNLNDNKTVQSFTTNERYELNMLVKQCELPRYNMNYEEKVQYNKKMYANTRIVYEPVVITFHDDMADTVNAFWKKYYEYEIADPVNLADDRQNDAKDDYYQLNRQTTKWGLDTPKQRKNPFLKGVEIFVLHKQRFTSMALVNPVIGSFNHDTLDQADGTGLMQNQMQLLYETVIYKSGTVGQLKGEKGFAQVHYDNEPSPLSVLGGGTNSIFGPGGVVDGIGSVISNAQNGNILGAILSATNTYNNAKKLKKSGVKEELRGLAKKGIGEIAKQSGAVSNPVAQFAVGGALILASDKLEASPRGTVDNNTGKNNTTITNSTVDTKNFLTAEESYNLVTTNETIKDEIASGIYFKDIGSRKGLTIAASNIEYSNATSNVKTVYRSKAVTDVRKLVNDGYIKISRDSQDVNVVIEKAAL